MRGQRDKDALHAKSQAFTAKRPPRRCRHAALSMPPAMSVASCAREGRLQQEEEA
jgi:hypothetical protein